MMVHRLGAAAVAAHSLREALPNFPGLIIDAVLHGALAAQGSSQLVRVGQVAARAQQHHHAVHAL